MKRTLLLGGCLALGVVATALLENPREVAALDERTDRFEKLLSSSCGQAHEVLVSLPPDRRQAIVEYLSFLVSLPQSRTPAPPSVNPVAPLPGVPLTNLVPSRWQAEESARRGCALNLLETDSVDPGAALQKLVATLASGTLLLIDQKLQTQATTTLLKLAARVRVAGGASLADTAGFLSSAMRTPQTAGYARAALLELGPGAVPPLLAASPSDDTVIQAALDMALSAEPDAAMVASSLRADAPAVRRLGMEALACVHLPVTPAWEALLVSWQDAEPGNRRACALTAVALVERGALPLEPLSHDATHAVVAALDTDAEAERVAMALQPLLPGLHDHLASAQGAAGPPGAVRVLRVRGRAFGSSPDVHAALLDALQGEDVALGAVALQVMPTLKRTPRETQVLVAAMWQGLLAAPLAEVSPRASALAQLPGASSALLLRALSSPVATVNQRALVTLLDFSAPSPVVVQRVSGRLNAMTCQELQGVVPWVDGAAAAFRPLLRARALPCAGAAPLEDSWVEFLVRQGPLPTETMASLMDNVNSPQTTDAQRLAVHVRGALLGMGTTVQADGLAGLAQGADPELSLQALRGLAALPADERTCSRVEPLLSANNLTLEARAIVLGMCAGTGRGPEFASATEDLMAQKPEMAVRVLHLFPGLVGVALHHHLGSSRGDRVVAALNAVALMAPADQDVAADLRRLAMDARPEVRRAGVLALAALPAESTNALPAIRELLLDSAASRETLEWPPGSAAPLDVLALWDDSLAVRTLARVASCRVKQQRPCCAP
jgi:HEAT repeat protein